MSLTQLHDLTEHQEREDRTAICTAARWTSEGEKFYMYSERRTYKRKGAGPRPPLQTGLLYICGQTSISVFLPLPLSFGPPSLRPSRVEPCNPSEEESACCALNKTNQAPNDICISNGPRCAEDSYYNGMSSQSRCIDKTWVIADDGAGVGVSLGACFIATLDELLLQRPMYHRRLVEHEHRLAAQKACTLPISAGSRPAQVTK